MYKSFLNEAFDRKFGFKDISDEVENEELKRPKRRKYSEAIDDNEKTVIYRELGKLRATPKSNYGIRLQDARKVQRLDDFDSAREVIDYYNKYFGTTDDDFEVLDEAVDYGGAFDVDPSQYFTRDDINEFAENVVDAINTKSYSKVTLISSYIENNVIEVTVEWDGNEATATQKIDMRKIRRPQQIDKYVKPISDELIRQLKEVGFDAGPHLSGQDYPLDEAFGIDDDEYEDILDGFIDMGYSDEDAERKIINGEYMYYAGVTDDAALGERYISDIGSIKDAVSNWDHYIDENSLRDDLSYDIDEIMREDAEEAVREEHKYDDESDYDFDEEVENWMEEHRNKYLDAEVENYLEFASSEEAERYFDYEAFGRDLRYDGWFYTDNGALYIE